jgi:hypothetical protein
VNSPGSSHSDFYGVQRARAACNAARAAAGIVKDYVLDLYYPIHGVRWRDKLRCSPLLLFIEYLVYRADATAESGKDIDLDAVRGREYETLAAYKARFIRILQKLDLYHRAAAREIERGEQYLRLENRVTSSRSTRSSPPSPPSPLNRSADHADVMRIAELRPSDVRLLHCLLFGLLHRPCDEELLSLLWPVEVIADIGNDLLHYADDVAHGRYNTYHMLVDLHGSEAPDVVRAEISRYERLFLDRLEGFPLTRRGELLQLCARLYRPRIATIPDPVGSVATPRPQRTAS